MTAPGGVMAFDVLVFLAVVVPFAVLLRHRHAIPLVPIAPTDVPLPALSVVIAARNEAGAIAPALTSLLAQDYSELEIVVVDDRSTDATGEIVRRTAAADARVRPVRVDALPPGWLGKNHALWRGADSARTEWILFTDADVVFAAGALRRAVGYAEAQGLDHLTLSPRLIARSVWLHAFVAFFGYVFVTLWGAYRANDPKSRRGVGVGAFNLVRRRAYDAIGTMRALSLRPDDDIRLGRRLRAFGFRQRVLNGRELISVEWYPSLRAAVSGLEKSLYASTEYRAFDAAAVVLFIAATMVWPYAGVVVLGGVDRILLAVVVLCLAAGCAETHRQSIGPLTAKGIAAVALFPVAAVSFAFAIVRSAFLAERRGITWRGTVYPLSLLRSQTGLEGAPSATSARGR